MLSIAESNNLSSEFIIPMMSPSALEIPLLKASLIPLSFSEAIINSIFSLSNLSL